MRRTWRGTEFGKGGQVGVLPVRVWERKPGLILAGIPGPRQELSHGRGQREGGQETLNLLSLRRKGWGGPFSEGDRGCSCPAAARGRRAGLARGTKGGDRTQVSL